ncbi:hypothetical protein A3B87_03330 [Candidatus Kuenenbacteria bacterium RIFCSPHIGHO2_02_FULL_39_13]|uniref:Glycosyl transferase family 1 domain-containing protein n=1 Tax=Candidatus Kuenenbacteria bacterium RIFCSPHIGHO2_02_FULL_39_13 TaxID=1798561 RepID=A0A1F6FM86_9BACT|nr:MAG: hypothetical protein A3B87_03330 [Candidatus Kuenenbacteria bacterium RIFCSPHIGHO2_02_FULL_39_13]
MTICYFGNYQKDYSRNDVLITGLKQNSCHVLECQTRARGIKKYLSLCQQHKKIKNKYDILIVGFAGHSLVWFAKLISNKPIVFDAFVSLYLSNVEDRGVCSPQSLKAKYYYFLDWLSCTLADKILLDTQAQIDYFIEKYKINKNKFIRVFVGANDKIFYPDSKSNPAAAGQNSEFIIHWHGYLVPFYGFATILEAAKILGQQDKNIKFRFITRFNNKSERFRNQAKFLPNVEFLDEQGKKDLAKYINQANCCLGVFGASKKAELVIPNKIVEALACRKPVITAKHQAPAELFNHQENIIFIEPGNAQALAGAILALKNNSKLSTKIATNGYQLCLSQLTPKILGRQLNNILTTL